MAATKFRELSSDELPQTLRTLRSVGLGRLRNWQHRNSGSNWEWYATPALRRLWDFRDTDDVLVDIGCGDSPDRLIAASWGRGMTTYGVDLYRPTTKATRAGFIQADGLTLPFGDKVIDFIVCTAMIDLVPIEDRGGFYAEIGRVLKGAGLLFFDGLPLRNGYGYKRAVEHERLRRSGFHYTGGPVYQVCGGKDNCPEFCGDMWDKRDRQSLHVALWEDADGH